MITEDGRMALAIASAKREVVQDFRAAIELAKREVKKPRAIEELV